MKITLDGDIHTIATALDAYLIRERNAQAEYTARGDTVLAQICDDNITSAAALQTEVLQKIGRCERHFTSGCADPLPHSICEV